MAAEHAGAAGPDPRELIAEAREAAKLAKEAIDWGREDDQYVAINAIDPVLGPLIAVAEAALARIAALEAENARLYEGWPESDDRENRSVYHSKIIQKGWVYWHGHEQAGPFATKREAVQAHLGLDAPAGGGE